MKRILFFTIALSLALLSCSDDDNQNKALNYSSLTGKWIVDERLLPEGINKWTGMYIILESDKTGILKMPVPDIEYQIIKVNIYPTEEDHIYRIILEDEDSNTELFYDLETDRLFQPSPGLTFYFLREQI